jgi:hypothetical protein
LLAPFSAGAHSGGVGHSFRYEWGSNIVSFLLKRSNCACPEISNRNARVQAKQNRWDRMRGLIEARAQEMKDVPGGETGMLVRDFKGKDANQVVYKFDASLVNELNKVEKQAAEELGQWVPKSETTTFDAVEMVKMLHEGRARATENYEARMLACAADVIDVEPEKSGN